MHGLFVDLMQGQTQGDVVGQRLADEQGTGSGGWEGWTDVSDLGEVPETVPKRPKEGAVVEDGDLVRVLSCELLWSHRGSHRQSRSGTLMGSRTYPRFLDGVDVPVVSVEVRVGRQPAFDEPVLRAGEDDGVAQA